jgi:hypothetical protein
VARDSSGIVEISDWAGKGALRRSTERAEINHNGADEDVVTGS